MRPANYTLQSLPPGRAGVRRTLEAMSRFVNQYKTNPQIFELARRIVQRVRGESWPEEARAMLNFVRAHIRYTKDIHGVETVQSPVQTLRLKTGDCDDLSVLLATLLASIGHPTKFVAVGFNRGSLSHVYVETRIGNNWVGMETTKPWPLGKKPPNIKEKMEHHN